MAGGRVFSGEVAFLFAARKEGFLTDEAPVTATLESLGPRIAVLDAAGRIVAVNEAWRCLAEDTGTDVARAGVGADYLRVCDLAVGPHAEYARATGAGIRAVLAGELPSFSLEYPCGRLRDPTWYLVSATRLSGAGGAVVVHADITASKRAADELRASEERLRLAVSAAAVGAWDWDVVTNVIHWSPDLERGMGFAPGEFRGTYDAFLSIVHRDDRAAVARAAEQILQAAGEHDAEFRVVRPDGRVRWAAVKGKVFCDARGTPVRMLGVALDVTRQKRHEAERAALLERERDARHAAEQANRAKDEFLLMLGHELRNPLAAAWSALAAAQLDESRQRRALSIARRQLEQLTRIVDDLLDVARVVRGRIELRPEPVSLGAVIERAADGIRPRLESEGQVLTLSLPADPVWVQADAARLEQVVDNLLTNAAKYTPPGGRIDVSAAREGESGVLRVRDTGVGISRDLLGRVFDLFMQADRSLGRAQGGLGIGLAIVKRLVELHGGTVEARSEGPGCGAEFIVRLPAPVRGWTPVPPATEPAARRLVGARVLVVEDREDVAEGLRMLLELCGHEVQVVADGPAALSAVTFDPPDVALVDIGLPGMSGYELASRARELPGAQDVVLVAVSGYGGDEDRRRALAAGFTAYLVKPVDVSALERVLALREGRRPPAPF